MADGRTIVWALTAVLALGAAGWPDRGAAEPLSAYEPYPDEIQAMDSYRADGSAENAHMLAAVRFRHAVALFEKADGTAGRAGAEVFARSLAYAESAVFLAPGVDDYWIFHALVAMSLSGIPRMQELAEISLSVALDLNPDRIEAHLLLAQVFFNQGRFRDSGALLDRVLAEASTVAESAFFVRLYTAAWTMTGDPLEGAHRMESRLNRGLDSLAARTARVILLRTADRGLPGSVGAAELEHALVDLRRALARIESASGSLTEMARVVADGEGEG
jgi:tetratricopeptide (TPR) repeat protein